MSAVARRPAHAAAPGAHDRAVQTLPASPGSASLERPATPQSWSRLAMPVKVKVFCRTGWERRLVEFNEHLRALFAIGRAGERELIEMVAAHFGLTPAEITGARGARRVVHARQVAMYMCRREFGTGAGALGRLFRRDPTSVIHAARKVAARIAEDPAFAAEVAALAAWWRDGFA